MDVYSSTELPALGFDQTPLSCNSFPPTPNSLPVTTSLHVHDGYLNSPSLLVDIKPGLQPKHPFRALPLDNDLTQEEVSNIKNISDSVARRLFSVLPNSKQDKSTSKSSAPEAIWYPDPDAIDTNFSQSSSSNRGRQIKYRTTIRDQKCPAKIIDLPNKDSDKISKAKDSTGEFYNYKLEIGLKCAHSSSATAVAFEKAAHQVESLLKLIELEIDYTSPDAGQPQIPLDHSKAVQNVNLAKILPYDAVQRLVDSPIQCISSTGRNQTVRCRHSQKWSLLDTQQLITLTRLSGAKTCSLATIAPLIFALITNAMCGAGKHYEIAMTNFRDLLQSVVGSDGNAQTRIPPPKTKVATGDIDAISDWIIALRHSMSKLDSVLAVQESYTPVLSRPKTARMLKVYDDLNITEPLLAALNAERLRTDLLSIDTALHQRFVPFLSEHRRGEPTEVAVHKAIYKPLTKRELDDGEIYVYWTPGSFGYVKIGLVTKQSIEKRLEQWKRDCGHDIEQVKLTDDENTSTGAVSTRVPHIWRVERLIHTELRQQRRRETGCDKCGKAHEEWFYTDPAHAKKVVLKWSKWMQENQPYDTQMDDDNIREMCKPLEHSPPIPNKERRQNRASTASRSQRRESLRPLPRRSPRNHTQNYFPNNTKPENKDTASDNIIKDKTKSSSPIKKEESTPAAETETTPEAATSPPNTKTPNTIKIISGSTETSITWEPKSTDGDIKTSENLVASIIETATATLKGDVKVTVKVEEVAP